ncbi:Rz-like spanin [Stenotrophomonas phage Philippe]|uniref:I-spanin n=1 Tax=Stenotrophomonas phage Philippe TaxID=2859655 RepID=A0AAE7WMP9_9CAUD|nr:Rz-like spanin [Stenotrophomonas phage Philippe]QYW02280.1 i-spanin [Stenotrophomonas phage Philippe]
MFLREIGKYLIIALLVLAPILWGYQKIKGIGFREGANSVQAKWDDERKKQSDAILAVKAEFDKKEVIHREENRRLTDELVAANTKHQAELARLDSDLRLRLRNSSERASVYQRQAQAGAVEQRALAEHAARLDAALEEGRALEQEYRSTLGQRDATIKALSDQIFSDRKLIND